MSDSSSLGSPKISSSSVSESESSSSGTLPCCDDNICILLFDVYADSYSVMLHPIGGNRWRGSDPEGDDGWIDLECGADGTLSVLGGGGVIAGFIGGTNSASTFTASGSGPGPCADGTAIVLTLDSSTGDFGFRNPQITFTTCPPP